jgi:hypothetical protein
MTFWNTDSFIRYPFATSYRHTMHLNTRDITRIPGPLFSFRSPSLFYLLVHSRCRGFLFSLDHTQTHTTVGRTPLDEGSARRRDLYLITQTLYKRQTSMSPGGIRTHDPSKRSAVDLRLRPRGHWDRLGPLF